MLLVRMYSDGESAYTSQLSAADVKVCFDLRIPCYLAIEATEDVPGSFILINTITDEGGYAGNGEFSVNEDGKLEISLS